MKLVISLLLFVFISPLSEAFATPAAERAELYGHFKENKLMVMRSLEAVEVRADEVLILKPVDLHFMLFGLETPLEKGQVFPLTLSFEKVGAIDVQVDVLGSAAMEPNGERDTIFSGDPEIDNDAGKEVERFFDFAIKAQKLIGGNDVIRVTQGENVRLQWTSDEITRIHLHGYDIETLVKPNAPVSMVFNAYATGRFPIEAHGFGDQASNSQAGHQQEETILLYLEVYPR